MDQDDQNGRPPDHDQGSRRREKAPASMAARIGASASGLLRESLLQPSASTVTSTLASSTASKGEPSHSASGSSDSALPFRSRAPDGLLNGGIFNAVGHSSQQESFRSGPRNNSNVALSSQQDIDGFLSTSTSQLPVSDNQLAYRSGVEWSTEEYPKFLDQPARQLAPKVAGTLDRHVGGDGDAVVALLSDPNFSVDDAPENNFSTSNGNGSAADLFTHTRFGLQDLQRYKSQLPVPPIHSVPSLTNPLNLIPDFVSRKTYGVDGDTLSSSGTTLSADGSFTDLYAQPHSSPDCLEPWMEVLTKYQDDVWGDMLPLVQQAREEVKVAKSGAQGALREHPALTRLRMISGHLDTEDISTKTHDTGHKLYQTDGMLTGSLNIPFQSKIATGAGEQSLNKENVMQDHEGVGLQRNSMDQVDIQNTSLLGSHQLNQATRGKETQIDKAKAESRALVEFDKASAIREAQDRQHITFKPERRITKNSATVAERPEDPISDLEEEDHFVWYHRIDLCMNWAEVKQAYDDHFPERGQEEFRNSQRNYYRCLDACGQTETKQSEQANFPLEDYGMRARTGLWYPWMRSHWL